MPGYFAQVEGGVVQQVRKVSAERIAAHPDLYPGSWVEVPEMSQYPAIGYWYDPQNGFRPDRPYPSWTWRTEPRGWVAPVPMPDDGAIYSWDESSKIWRPE